MRFAQSGENSSVWTWDVANMIEKVDIDRLGSANLWINLYLPWASYNAVDFIKKKYTKWQISDIGRPNVTVVITLK